MGLMKKHYSSTYDSNPDPKNYRVIEEIKIKNYLLILINYPDAKNFEGNKILLYKNIQSISELLLKNKGKIDPHFCEYSVSPIARFYPTQEGWKNAIMFAQIISDKEDCLICKDKQYG